MQYVAADPVVTQARVPGLAETVWDNARHDPEALQFVRADADVRAWPAGHARQDETFPNRANRAVSQAEQIKTFQILPREVTEAGGELTPTLKVKRNVVAERYGADIEALYPRRCCSGEGHLTKLKVKAATPGSGAPPSTAASCAPPSTGPEN